MAAFSIVPVKISSLIWFKNRPCSCLMALQNANMTGDSTIEILATSVILLWCIRYGNKGCSPSQAGSERRPNAWMRFGRSVLREVVKTHVGTEPCLTKRSQINTGIDLPSNRIISSGLYKAQVAAVAFPICPAY